MTDQIDDKSLLRCTVKKSVHVFERLFVYIAYLIVGCTIGAITYLGVTNILFPSVAYGVIVAVAFLVSIPWYYYAGAVALLAVPAYSFLWCVARDLTEEDWESNSANNFAVAVAFAAAASAFAAAAFAAFVFAVASAFAFAFAAAAAFAAVSVAFAFAAFAAFAAVAFAFADPVDKITVWYYVFRFLGASWNHYMHTVGLK